jgi:hypothetical protein
MRFFEIKTNLFEISMAPKSLIRAAQGVPNALVGFEFELYFPSLVEIQDPRMLSTADNIPTSFRDISNFFLGRADANIDPEISVRIADARRALKRMHIDIQHKDLIKAWKVLGRKAIKKRNSMLKPKQVKAYYEAFLNRLLAEAPLLNDFYLNDTQFYLIQDYFLDVFLKLPENKEIADKLILTEHDFLKHLNKTFRQLSKEYDIPWPTHHNISKEEIAASFSKAIGKNVKNGSGYHSVERDNDSYIMEPDGSLQSPVNFRDYGLEFVSPPLTLEEAAQDLKKVLEWASENKCYTNSSTGLHMNVSVGDTPFAQKTFDYLKLLLFLGDRFILEKFGRIFNGYADQTSRKVATQFGRLDDSDVLSSLDYLKNGLVGKASEALTNISNDKYNSVHVHYEKGYVEFRGPGGNWLGHDYSELMLTALRCVIAMDAACSPEKYKKEYTKKIYKFLSDYTSFFINKKDILSLFSAYSSGFVSRNTLKTELVKRSKTKKQKVNSEIKWDLKGMFMADLINYRDQNGVGSPNYDAAHLEFMRRRGIAHNMISAGSGLYDSIEEWDRQTANNLGISVSDLRVDYAPV